MKKEDLTFYFSSKIKDPLLFLERWMHSLEFPWCPTKVERNECFRVVELVRYGGIIGFYYSYEWDDGSRLVLAQEALKQDSIENVFAWLDFTLSPDQLIEKTKLILNFTVTMDDQNEKS